MRQYRLIYDPPMTGRFNMAVDEAVLNAVAAGDSPPTLRLYGWNPACLSLGYGQTWHDADLARLKAAGWDIVRRPTGGKAILHADELTYSLALPADHPIAQGGIVESYRRISQALMIALSYLGLSPQSQPKADDVKIEGPVCFEVPSHYEITMGDGRKLMGSAQLRRRGGVLQHGSLPLYGDVTRICEVLAYPDDVERQRAKAQVKARAVTLAEALGGHIMTWEMAADAIVAGFEDVFDVTFVAVGLSEVEQVNAMQLANEVYGSELRIKRI